MPSPGESPVQRRRSRKQQSPGESPLALERVIEEDDAESRLSAMTMDDDDEQRKTSFFRTSGGNTADTDADSRPEQLPSSFRDRPPSRVKVTITKNNTESALSPTTTTTPIDTTTRLVTPSPPTMNNHRSNFITPSPTNNMSDNWANFSTPSPTEQRRTKPSNNIIRSPENPVQAKVSIDLSSTPSNLTYIMKHSGILTGSPLPEMPQRPTTISSISSTVSSLSSPNREAKGGEGGQTLVSDDDTCRTISSRSLYSNSNDNMIIVQTNDQAIPGNVVHHGSRIVTSPTTTTQTSPTRRSRGGPIDVDNVTSAERNLQAIHVMAAEHLSHGEYEEALEVFYEIYRGQRERYGGDNHYRIGTALHNIGIVHLKMKNFQKAIDTSEKAVRVRKRTLATDHPELADSLAQLGVAQLEAKQHREALVTFRGALNTRRTVFGMKHPKVGKVLNNIGCALYELKELHGANLAFQEALEIQRDTLKSTNVDQTNQVMLSIASTLCNIGSIKLEEENFEEAAVALEEALLIQQSVLGDDHPTVLNTLQSIDHIERSCETAILDSAVSADYNNNLLFPWSSDENKEEDQSHSRTVERWTMLMKSLRWSGSQRWYQKVGEFLPETTCGGGDGFSQQNDDDDDASLEMTKGYEI